MIITCEACGTNYKIKASLISKNGSTVKCSRCQHIFVAYPPAAETDTASKHPPEKDISSADYPRPHTSTFFEDAAETEKTLDEIFSEEPEVETPGKQEQQPSESESEDMEFSDFEPAPQKTRAGDLESETEEISLSDLELDEASEAGLAGLEYGSPAESESAEETEEVDLSELEPEETREPEEEVSLAELETRQEEVSLTELEPEKPEEIKEPEEIGESEMPEESEQPDLSETRDEEPEEVSLEDLGGAEAPSSDAGTIQEEFDLELDETEGEQEEAEFTESPSGDTVQEEFDLDFEFGEEDLEADEEREYDLDLDEVDFDLDLETEEELKTEEDRFEPEQAEHGAGGVDEEIAEDDGLELELDFEEPEDAAQGSQEPEEKEAELDTEYGESGTFDLELDLDEESEEEPAIELEPEQEEEQEPQQQMAGLGGTTEAEPFEFDLGLEEETGQEAERPGTSAEAEDLDLELDLDTGQGPETEQEDFELDLATMFDDSPDEQDREEKDVALEPVESQEEEFEQVEEEEDSGAFFEPQAEPAAESHGSSIYEKETASETSYRHSAPFPPPGRKRGRRVLKTLGLLIVLALIGGGAYLYFYGPGLSVIPGLGQPSAQDIGNMRIAVSSPDYRIVENEQAGRLLVVSGTVTNRYDHPRSHILVRANLLDGSGNRVGRSAAYCGNIFGEDQLKTLNVDTINQRLSRSRGEGGSNVALDPGQSLPYMVVFSNLPGTMENLTVEVMSSEKAE